MAYINYQPQSATGLLSSLLGLKQTEMTENQNRRNMIYQGIKDAGNAAGNVIGYMKRKGAIQYLGDAKLAEMKQELARLKDELTTVQNQMRTIKAEDKGSLDTFANTPTTHNAEMDVNAYSPDGGRFASNRIDTYESAADYIPTEADFEHPEANARENIPPEVKAKYKIGLRSLGGM